MELIVREVNLPKEYGITDQKIQELANKYADLTAIKDTASMQMAVAGRREHRKLRVEVEHKRKELKADALEFGRKVDAEAKRIAAELAKTETRLDELIKAEEARKEELRQAKLREIAEAEAAERARVDAIRGRIEARYGDSEILALHSLPSTGVKARLESETDVTEADGFAEFTEEAQRRQAEFCDRTAILLADKVQAEEAAENQRIEAERLAEERKRFEEEQRLAREKAEAEERARLELLRKEQEERDQRKAEIEAAMRAEQEKLEAEREAIRREQEAMAAEKNRIEAERLAKIRAEESRLQAEIEAKEKLEREAREEAERAEAERIRAEYEASLRPDKEKILAFAGTVAALQVPSLNSKEGLNAADKIKAKIRALVTFANEQAEKLAEGEQ